MTSSCLLDVILEQRKFFVPVINHEFTVMVKLTDALVHFVVMIHNKHIAQRIVNHENFNQFEELIITVYQSLLFS